MDSKEKKVKKTLLFTMIPEIAVEFWERVNKENAQTEPERLKILMDLANEGKMNGVSVTGRSKEQVIQDYSKHFKTLYIKPKETGHGE